MPKIRRQNLPQQLMDHLGDRIFNLDVVVKEEHWIGDGFYPWLEDLFLTRRDFLSRCGLGFGMLSLANLLGPQSLAATA